MPIDEMPRLPHRRRDPARNAGPTDLNNLKNSESHPPCLHARGDGDRSAAETSTTVAVNVVADHNHECPVELVDTADGE
jgi:hypothetical protein